MQSLTPTDATLLAFFTREPKALRDLRARHPKATLYRRLDALRARGLVAKQGRLYALTSAGEQLKAELEAGTSWEGLGAIYPPLNALPTPQHRAMAELALAALVLRQRTHQEERHAGFAFIGPPLTGKTSTGQFLCLAAGVDPATHIVDLSSESGKSLWIRRGPGGEVVAQRALLEAPLVVFDEFQQADRAVRRALAPFLSGRRRLPFENTIVNVMPVPVIALNPGPGATLTARTGLSLPHLRRLVPCDLGAIAVPDLALEGGRALEAVQRAGPLSLRAPRGACEGFRADVVRLLRQTLLPEALGLADVELLLGLGRGLTAWLSEPVAIRQILYDFLLAVETLGWVQPGWVARLRTFPGGAPVDQREPQGTSGALVAVPPQPLAERTIALFPERSPRARAMEGHPMHSRESMMPAFAISDHTKGLMAWMAVDAGTSVDQVVAILVDVYRLQRSDDLTFGDLLAVVRLREACEAAEISVRELRIAVELNAGLHERGLGVLDDIPTTLQVADDLAEAGLSLKDAVAVAGLMKALKKARVDPRVPEQLQAALERYGALGYEPTQITRLADCWSRLTGLGLGLNDLEPAFARLHRLTELGLDEDTAEALVTTLDLAGIPADQRAAVLAKAVELSQAGMGLAQVQADREALQEEIQQLRDEQGALEEALAAGQDELARIQQEQDQARAELAALREQATRLENAIPAGRALQGFLLGDLDAADEFYIRVAAIREMRRTGSPQFPGLETWLTAKIQERVRDFLTQVSTRPLPPSPSSQGTSAKG